MDRKQLDALIQVEQELDQLEQEAREGMQIISVHDGDIETPMLRGALQKAFLLNRNGNTKDLRCPFRHLSPGFGVECWQHKCAVWEGMTGTCGMKT